MTYCVISEDYQDELGKLIDADTFPKFWGGNKVDEDGDPRCSKFVSLM